MVLYFTKKIKLCSKSDIKKQIFTYIYKKDARKLGATRQKKVGTY